jgi:hypothetical protein
MPRPSEDREGPPAQAAVLSGCSGVDAGGTARHHLADTTSTRAGRPRHRLDGCYLTLLTPARPPFATS